MICLNYQTNLQAARELFGSGNIQKLASIFAVSLSALNYANERVFYKPLLRLLEFHNRETERKAGRREGPRVEIVMIFKLFISKDSLDKFC